MSRVWISLLILTAWVAMAVAQQWLPLAPNLIDLERILLPPNTVSPLGYDDLGRPILDRLVEGAQTSLWVSVLVVSVSASIGTLLGAWVAYQGGWWDRVFVRILDIFLAFPGILLAIVLAGLLGPGLGNVVIALSAVGWVGFARLARAQTLSLKHREHVHAARSLGVTPLRLVVRHIIPLLMAPLIVEATFGIAAVVIAEAGLSFLGLGVQPPQASWGSMIRDGSRYLLVAPHMVLAPGVALMLVVLAVNRVGDALRDWLDVRSREWQGSAA